jgi:hypothetical protein
LLFELKWSCPLYAERCKLILDYGGHFAQAARKSIVLKYLSPRSQIIVTTVPAFISFAIRTAPATAAPLDMPAKIPSSAANRRVKFSDKRQVLHA